MTATHESPAFLGPTHASPVQEGGEGDAWVVETLRRHEPATMHTQHPVVWDRAAGSRVYNREGRSWLDWTSGILTANAGHARAEVVDAITEQARQGLLHAYMFPTRVRARTVRALSELTGFPQSVLYTTGAEAVEGALKISSRHAMARRPRSAAARPSVVVSFEGAFHGRTLGAQLSGGLPAQRDWAPELDEVFVRVPYPGRGEGWNTEVIEDALRKAGAGPEDVACVVGEIYQGSTLRQIDPEAARALREWCTRHGALLIFDEIQSGFGRTGALFAYEHIGVRPDLLLVAKGLSGSLPISAVLIGDERFAANVRPGELTSTHSGNPISLAAAEANLALYADGRIVAEAARRGRQLAEGLADWAARLPARRRIIGTMGLIAGVACTSEDGALDPGASQRLAAECIERGLLVCVPSTLGGAMLKIMPPVTTSEDELAESLALFNAAADAAQCS
ncbi:aspartate aminotransferase family protein (plasmid) [Streptomyces sp. NBC_01343]|uniref:Aspartate aminotransferase family protein n=1 Tax=Streptomyces flavotricini TaxID=66888 RepID=A0ABS8EGE9_9ACTN|nr:MULTISPECIES: aspartate aminotransferase family protein [Streptomyces]MCC0100227.1 aspartate aminotransferase family protein [Streptomyces flavotricini]WSI29563.1 aspartate aminotransferase family protein [Streptomyces sp. NBC_01343]